MTRYQPLYTTPVICRCKNGEWFVFFRYWDASQGKYRPFKRSEDLNRIKNIKEKEAEFKALRDAREMWLEAGWNPITNTFPSASISEMEHISKLKDMTLVAALDFAFKKREKDWGKKTKQDYSSKLKYLLQAIFQLNMTSFRIGDVRRPHYKLILNHVWQERKLSAKGYNLYREFLSTLLGELDQWEVLEYNPVEKITPKQVLKKVSHRPPTQDQRLLIINRIRNEHRPYYRFLAILYGCTIRPKEITGIKIKSLHRLEQMFRLIPDGNSTTKTKTERDVAIPDWVMDLLMEMNLHNYDPEWYIFSSRNKYGTFLPGPNRMHSNTPTGWWRKLVKDPPEKGGLGQDVDQYSLKKLSGDDMVRLQRREGVDKLLDLPKMQMGHSSNQMTEVYVTEHKEIMKELVKRKMPVL